MMILTVLVNNLKMPIIALSYFIFMQTQRWRHTYILILHIKILRALIKITYLEMTEPGRGTSSSWLQNYFFKPKYVPTEWRRHIPWVQGLWSERVRHVNKWLSYLILPLTSKSPLWPRSSFRIWLPTPVSLLLSVSLYSVLTQFKPYWSSISSTFSLALGPPSLFI